MEKKEIERLTLHPHRFSFKFEMTWIRTKSTGQESSMKCLSRSLISTRFDLQFVLSIVSDLTSKDVIVENFR